jgi:hypothetical protein
LRRKRSNAVRKGSKSLAKKKQLVDTSNEVNQNNHITEEFAQFEGGMEFLLVQFLSSFVLNFHTF